MLVYEQLYTTFFIMITKIIDRTGSIMESPKTNDLLYINEIAPDCEFVQNIINKHTNMKHHINNIIKKLLFHKVIK